MNDTAKIVLLLVAVVGLGVVACAGRAEPDPNDEEDLTPCERAQRALESFGCMEDIGCATAQAEPEFWQCIEENAEKICKNVPGVVCVGGPQAP